MRQRSHSSLTPLRSHLCAQTPAFKPERPSLSVETSASKPQRRNLSVETSAFKAQRSNLSVHTDRSTSTLISQRSHVRVHTSALTPPPSSSTLPPHRGPNRAALPGHAQRRCARAPSAPAPALSRLTAARAAPERGACLRRAPASYATAHRPARAQPRHSASQRECAQLINMAYALQYTSGKSCGASPAAEVDAHKHSSSMARGYT